MFENFSNWTMTVRSALNLLISLNRMTGEEGLAKENKTIFQLHLIPGFSLRQKGEFIALDLEEGRESFIYPNLLNYCELH